MRPKFKLLAILAISLLACSCANSLGQAKCRHTALMAALIASEEYPVCIIVTEGPSGRHAQAQAKINGKWEYLGFEGGRVLVSDREDNQGEIVGVYTLDDYYRKLRRLRSEGTMLYSEP